MKNFHALKPIRSLSDFVYCRASPHSKKLSGWTGELKDCELGKFSRPQTSQISFGFCILLRLSPFEKTKRVDGGSSQAAGEAHLVSNFLSISLFLFPPSCSLLSLCTGSSCLARAGGHAQASGSQIFLARTERVKTACVRVRARPTSDRLRASGDSSRDKNRTALRR